MRSVIAVLCAVAIAACGGGDETTTAAGTTTSSTQPDTTTTPPEESTTTVEAPEPEPAGATDPLDAVDAVLTSRGTAEQACETFVTEHFIQTAYGGRANCVAARAGDLADGYRATVAKGNTQVDVIPKGGPYDGAKVEVDLVRDGDTYRVDALEAHVPAGP